ncbi:PaaI family thioesterase [Saccharopolyspora sp. ASAGF58]|uniref:PaaI family thioesterase n=1 Tax=Saccharopolyspora sp. ASAGF58 TaxID=2719023 RepID=UPI00143FCB1C|nr:PaaI family thioesterase [Saccharopolyspora sp. ASAGF58]QIZ38716.1 PaaI family thioesterase [Saccharopolyspora sp. ASAGF58]
MSQQAPSLFEPLAEYGAGTADYEKLREITNSMVPFSVHVGVQITEIGPERAVAEIPAEDTMNNHMGSVHAGALFLAADIANGSAFVGAMAARLASVTRFVVRESRCTFLKPAFGRIRAIATVDERIVSDVLSRNSTEKFDIDTKALCYNDNDVLVAKFSFDCVCNIAAD